MRTVGIAMAAALAAGCTAPARSEGETMTYKDGTYSADGLYGGLPSKLTVTVTLKGDRIGDVKVGTHATDPTSLEYQRGFAAAVPAVVRGKPLAEVKVGKLAGASGCPDGFNAAIAKIREQARR